MFKFTHLMNGYESKEMLQAVRERDNGENGRCCTIDNDINILNIIYSFFSSLLLNQHQLLCIHIITSNHLHKVYPTTMGISIPYD